MLYERAYVGIRDSCQRGKVFKRFSSKILSCVSVSLMNN